MKNLWKNIELLRKGKNYLWGDGYNASYMYYVLKKMDIPIDGFIRVYNKNVNMLFELPIVEVQDLIYDDCNILITQNKWMDLYDLLVETFSKDRIYTIGNWEYGSRCIICGKETTITGGGEFVPFLNERMFKNNPPKTAVIHCTHCRTYYSEYRPDDTEMSRLYNGYRNEEYQKMRHKYEPEYTEQFNKSLFDPKDEAGRRERIYGFITENIKNSAHIKTILDFGGDKGQFIPKQWSDKRRIVYEISNPEVVEGVELIEDYTELAEINPDLIMCNQVLEHVSDVAGYFNNLVMLLKKGAYLYIEVPNERWCVDQEFVRFHEHINFFSDKTFEILAEETEISLIKVAHDNTVIRALFCRL